jgi:hypothetical protein
MMWRRMRQVHSGRLCRKDPLYSVQVPRTNPVSLPMQWDWQGSAHRHAASAVHFSGAAVSCNAGSEAANGREQAALRRRIGRADLEREYQQVAARWHIHMPHLHPGCYYQSCEHLSAGCRDCFRPWTLRTHRMQSTQVSSFGMYSRQLSAV